MGGSRLRLLAEARAARRFATSPRQVIAVLLMGVAGANEIMSEMDGGHVGFAPLCDDEAVTRHDAPETLLRRPKGSS